MIVTLASLLLVAAGAQVDDALPDDDDNRRAVRSHSFGSYYTIDILRENIDLEQDWDEAGNRPGRR